MNIDNKDQTVMPIIIPLKNSLQSVNFYLIKSEDSLTLIDAGYNNDECWQALERVLNENGFTVGDIDQILLTHHHIDHIGLVNRISRHKDVPIYAHAKSIPRLKRDKEFLTMRATFLEDLYNEMGCGEDSKPYVRRIKRSAKDPNGFIVEGEITLLTDHVNQFQVLETPGHAVDHVVFFDERRNWLFAGDLLLSKTSTNALIEPDENMQRIQSLSIYRNSLMSCQKLDVQVTFSGHQQLIYNHKELIQVRLNRIDEKAERLVRLIKNLGTSTASEIALAFYKQKYKSEFPLVMSEIIGQLDYLGTQEKVSSTLKNSVRYYSVEQ